MSVKIAIVGAGAAGLLAAVIAARNGASVTLYEKNERVGIKLSITGKGRCNVTNNSTPSKVIENIPTNPKFMYTALNAFSPTDTMAFFEELGVPLKTERGDRVFPVSDKAKDVVNALVNEINRLGVTVIHRKVSGILIQDGIAYGVCVSGKEYAFDKVIVATGGVSYPKTGSNGDGYRFAESCGIEVISPKPSLVPIETEEKWTKAVSGLSLKNVTLTIEDTTNGKTVYEDFGEMLFTHFGISGPMVLSASSHLRKMQPGRYVAHIDMKPALDEKTLDERLLADFKKYSNKDFINAMGDLLPKTLIPIFIGLTGIGEHTKVNTITKEQRHKILSLLKNIPLRLKSFRPIDEAIITSGGVSVKELSPKTMESKKITNLFFAGEVIDVDAYTGGFNLQIAFSTAYLAAITASERND